MFFKPNESEPDWQMSDVAGWMESPYDEFDL